MSRESLLELDHQRTHIEHELASILDYLNAPGMPGLHGPLVDVQGFPSATLDLYKIREARQRFNMLNNDHTALMKQIEEQLTAYYGAQPAPEARPLPRTEVVVSAVSTVREELPPFAYISEVTEESPACTAGIAVNDRITKVGGVTAFNHNNLSALAEEVKSHLNRPLALSLLRRNELNEEVPLELTITPQKWSGPGVLGCRFMPLSPS